MPLSLHVDADKLIEDLYKENPNISKEIHDLAIHNVHDPYESKYTSAQMIPRFSIPQKGVDPEVAYQAIHDHLELDGRPLLNFASFVNTYVHPLAAKLASENLTKNLSDAEEYPSMLELHSRCISILSNLWHAPHGGGAIGTATTGSSEAIMLGGLAMKHLWRERRKNAGKDFSKPNIIMGANAQVALEKFARYFDVEMRLVPVTEKSRYRMDTTKIRDYLDENTIGIFVILGSTFTGHYEPVEEVHNLLDEYEKETGTFVPIHVDGASGGMIAPFVHPDLKWDFRLPRVVSINTSGHKFGLASAGLGWVIWRDGKHLPKDLIFELRYLGGVDYSFNLNFSRPGFPVIEHYFYLLHLGREGYAAIHGGSLRNARLLSKFLEETGYFKVLSDIHRKRGVFNKTDENFHSDDATDYNEGLPVVAFQFTDEFRNKYPNIKQDWVQKLLRIKGYIVPNYPLPPNEDKKEILRVVVRQSMSTALLYDFLRDIASVIQDLMTTDRETIELMSRPFRHHAGLFTRERQALQREYEKVKGHPVTYRGVC